MKLTYIKQAGEPNGDAGDQYTGLDRFGRVVDQRWPQGEDELERVDYGFTAASNRQWRQNLVAATGQDEYYNYDGLYQVAELNRGTLNGTKTAITGTPSWTEDFTYDPIGNWDAYLTKVSGVTDLDQTRTHNTANETTEIDGSSTTVAHDLAGNMVKVPQVADWSSTNELKWDAWNRLVEVVDGETTVAQYRYDGLTRRISKEADATRHYYYSAQWQIVEERVDSETAAERQFVWGQRYLDDLVLRDRDIDHDGSLDERLYVLSDYFNPTAVADEDGVVLERYGYNAFGLSRVMTPDFEPRSSSDFDWETRYGAYRYDPETGFYQVRYRYLHPTLGRWLRRDPIGELGGYNAFSYVNNKCNNFIDNDGLKEFDLNKGYISNGIFIGTKMHVNDAIVNVLDVGGKISVESEDVGNDKDVAAAKCALKQLGFNLPDTRNGLYWATWQNQAVNGYTVSWPTVLSDARFSFLNKTRYQGVSGAGLINEFEAFIVTVWHEVKGHNEDGQPDSAKFDATYEAPVNAAIQAKKSEGFWTCILSACGVATRKPETGKPPAPPYPPRDLPGNGLQ